MVKISMDFQKTNMTFWVYQEDCDVVLKFIPFQVIRDSETKQTIFKCYNTTFHKEHIVHESLIGKEIFEKEEEVINYRKDLIERKINVLKELKDKFPLIYE